MKLTPTSRYLLRLILFLQCWGMATHRWFQEETSLVGNWLMEHHSWTEASATMLDTGVSVAMGMAGTLCLFYPSWIFIIPVALWIGSASTLPAFSDQNSSNWMLPLQNAVLYLSPLAVAWIEFKPFAKQLSSWRNFSGVFLLRVAVAITFVGMGIAAINFHPNREAMVDAITQFFQVTLNKATLDRSLVVIGILEIALGLNVLLARSQFVVLILFIWGVLTTASASLTLTPLGKISEIFILVPIAGIPLVIFLCWRANPFVRKAAIKTTESA